MSFDYHESTLWKKTLGKENSAFLEDVKKLKMEFEDIRQEVACLAAGISNQFPEYTLHDVLHIDELWQTADIILENSSIQLNPAEAFVLGCSFLFHDLGMSGIVYSNRESLENCDLWKDSLAHYVKKGVNLECAKRLADSETLRQKHPENAAKLPFYSFDKDSERVYIIKKEELRAGYGEIIGKLAYSHGMPINDFDSIFPTKKLGACGSLPAEWTIDVYKLAGILRIADAIHIYSNRTPSILMASKTLNSLSKRHWIFQSKLNKPRSDRGRLEFTSSSSFTVNEYESWWLCYDILKMIDNELLTVGSLFDNNNIEPLGVFCVKNIDTPESLSRLVTTYGWTPIDSKICVSNVSSLINSLGGKALYGNASIIPLRELVQNSSDAIQAKCELKEMEKGEGRIDIRFGSDEKGDFIEIEDNGIGMSQKVLTGPFLDFGSSFWNSELMRKEIPGLESTNFQSTGHFGIGFFSVFMWGDKVSVTTLRSGNAFADTKILEFDSGTSSRPLLRNADFSEWRKKSGTKIKVWVKDLESIKQGIVNQRWDKTEKTCASIYYENFENITLNDQLFVLCCGLDVDVYFNDMKLLNSKEWKKMSNVDFVKKYCRICHWLTKKIDIEEYAPKVAERVRFLINSEGECVGRGLLDPFLKGHLVAGGVKVCNTYGFAGIMFGNCLVASRTSGLPVISESDFSRWIDEQVALLDADKSWEEDDDGMECVRYALEFTTDTKGLSIALNQNKKVNYQYIIDIIQRKKLQEVIFVDKNELFFIDEIAKKDFFENVFFCHWGYRDIVLCENGECFPHEAEYYGGTSLIKSFLDSFWGTGNVEIVFFDRDKENKRVVGKYEGKEIKVNHWMLFRKKC